MTRIDLRIQKAKGLPVCIGAGFVALDIVKGESGTFATAGGSCGNVMAILAWLGWLARPLSRLGTDPAGDMIAEQLLDSGVDISGLIRDESVSTPIVIQRSVAQEDGGKDHRYSLSCPDCGRWLPRFRATTLRQIEPFLERVGGVKAYYLDRVTPASLTAAAKAAAVGALVVFEPSAIGDESAFQQAVDLCDVLKYASDRLGHVPDLHAARHPSIVIETMGADGLWLRWRKRWSRLAAFEIAIFRDAAGSGDWCTAGLIHSLGVNGRKALAGARKADIEKSLRFGQALAALNCGFEGARGLMSVKQTEAINRALRGLQEKSSPSSDWASLSNERSFTPMQNCELCAPKTERRTIRRAG